MLHFRRGAIGQQRVYVRRRSVRSLISISPRRGLTNAEGNVCFQETSRNCKFERPFPLATDTVEKLKKEVAIKSRRAPVEPGSCYSNAL
jgi:hypothetical protein